MSYADKHISSTKDGDDSVTEDEPYRTTEYRQKMCNKVDLER
jgi:hypothetical protein